MNTPALNEALEVIRSYKLTAAEKQWLANRLYNDAKGGSPVEYEIAEDAADMLNEEMPLEPYTMEEINARLDEAEREFEAGGGIDNEDVFREAWSRVFKEKIA